MQAKYKYNALSTGTIAVDNQQAINCWSFLFALQEKYYYRKFGFLSTAVGVKFTNIKRMEGRRTQSIDYYSPAARQRLAGVPVPVLMDGIRSTSMIR